MGDKSPKKREKKKQKSEKNVKKPPVAQPETIKKP